MDTDQIIKRDTDHFKKKDNTYHCCNHVQVVLGNEWHPAVPQHDWRLFDQTSSTRWFIPLFSVAEPKQLLHILHVIGGSEGIYNLGRDRKRYGGRCWKDFVIRTWVTFLSFPWPVTTNNSRDVSQRRALLELWRVSGDHQSSMKPAACDNHWAIDILMICLPPSKTNQISNWN